MNSILIPLSLDMVDITKCNLNKICTIRVNLTMGFKKIKSKK